MITSQEFRIYAHQFVDWMAEYLEDIEKYPVKSQIEPGTIYNQLPERAPENSESIEQIMQDFQEIILPGMTHWQSPNFFAYFPANSSYPAVLAEMLTATLAAQCMLWETSPAATELEEKVLNWLKEMLGIPYNFSGVIQDTASTATLCAIISAREKYSNFQINESGYSGSENYRIYCSAEAHSSVEKAIKIAGIGRRNIIKIEVDDQFRLKPQRLKKAIEHDIAHHKKPICVVATLGTTGTTAIDPLEEIAHICHAYDSWLHVDAAYAGTALILPEYRWMIKGVELVDSFVFNPHKWMFTNFDCSVYFVKNQRNLIRAFEILPEYLKTTSDRLVNNYRDWGIALGRRFRALKLWFVVRNYGIDGLRQKIRYHIALAKKLACEIEEHPEFELMAPQSLSLVCFRFKPININDENALNILNEKLLNRLNATGKIYLTHTKVRGSYTLRLVIGQTNVTQKHVDHAWNLIQNMARNLE